jgi:hypothetical protein
MSPHNSSPLKIDLLFMYYTKQKPGFSIFIRLLAVHFLLKINVKTAVFALL